MMPRKRSSSRSSESSVEVIEKRSKNRSKNQDHQLRTSSSSSPEQYRRSKKSRSRSPKYSGPANKILELDKERTKNYDFNDEINGKVVNYCFKINR